MASIVVPMVRFVVAGMGHLKYHVPPRCLPVGILTVGGKRFVAHLASIADSTILHFTKAFSRFCLRTLFWFAIAFALLFCAAVVALKSWVLPRVQQYEGDILARVSQASRMDVTARSLRGGWSGFTPYIELDDVAFREPAGVKSPTRTAGAVALRLPALRASLSIPYLLVGQIRLDELSFFGPELTLMRATDGFIYFAGHAINKPRAQQEEDGRLIDWLLEQPGVDIQRATLVWRDELAASPALTFRDVGIAIAKRRGRHVLGFTAAPPAALARRLEMRGNLDIGKDRERWYLRGQAYVAATDADLGELRRHVNLPDAWQAGIGNVRTWVELDFQAPGEGVPLANPVKRVTADVHILQAKARLGDDVAPLQMAKLAGRLVYRAEEGGFTVGSERLEFRTREGVVSPPADFSFTLQYPDDAAKTRGSLRANGIELKVMSALIEYFPIGRDVRQTVARLGLRGEVRDTVVSWTGAPLQPATYRITGKLSGLSSQPFDRIPGVEGFSGTIDGNQEGGRFEVQSRGFGLDVPHFFAAPLKFDSLEAKGSWKVNADEVVVALDRVVFANEDVAGELAGRYSRYRAGGQSAAKEKGPGSVDITGTLSRAKATSVAKYLPNGIAKPRDYVGWAVQGGDVTGAEFLVQGELYEFPFRGGNGGHFKVAAKIKDVDFRFAEAWPAIGDIRGSLVFENTGMRAAVESARIFGSRVRATTVELADFAAAPMMLSVIGSADARAEDAARYLRESPLVEGVGAFTRYVAFDGPGRLQLDLKLPLGPAAASQKPRIAGRYQFLRASARPTIGPAVGNLTGHVAFTEGSVKSTAVVGSAYDHPLTVEIAGGGGAPVTVEFQGRADMRQLDDVLPFRLPQQVSGSTDFKGRIAAGSAAAGADRGVRIDIESPLQGVASTLPFPLTKRAEEARAFGVHFRNVGLLDESIQVTLAGTADTRIDARVKRRFDAEGHGHFWGGIASVGTVLPADPALAEGMWLSGSLRELQADHWLDAYRRFYPPAAGGEAPVATGSPIAGFDFAIGTLIAYGRPFPALRLKGRYNGETWAMSVASKEAEGDFTWRGSAYSQRGAVRARLKTLSISDEVPETSPRATGAGQEVPPADLPALDIVADSFTLKDRWLGKLELKATPQGANWKIDQLVLSNGHARAEMDGIWQRYGDPFAAGTAGTPDKDGKAGGDRSLTSVNIKLEASNLNALFAQFGHGDQMSGGKGTLEGRLNWPGHTYQFRLANLGGEFKLAAERGQFKKIQPGAGKLLALISLQSIPRRLTLDFRDIFSEGLGFDSITGDVKIRNGIMFTDNFRIQGTAADIQMAGDISLPAERQNLRVKVTPSLGEGAAIGAGIILGPVVGAGVLAVQKMLQQGLVAEYGITGTWDNPQVEKLNRGGTSVAVPPATSPTPAATAAPPAAVPTIPAGDDKKPSR